MKVMGVNKGKIMKNSSNRNKIIRRKKRFNFLNKIPGIISYLRSDFHLYSPLITSSSSSYYSTLDNVQRSGLVINEPIIRNGGGEFKEKLVKYLKSDAYFYAPLGRMPFLLQEEVQFTRVTNTVLSKKIAWQTKQVAQDSIGDLGKDGDPDIGIISPPTPGSPGGKKQATRRSVRDLSKSSK